MYPTVQFQHIPIHIHQIQHEVSQRARIKSLKPGIHYAVRSCRSENGLRAMLRKGLHECINGQHLPFAGIARGGLFAPAIEADFQPEEREDLYAIGINPLFRSGGNLYVWGNIFVDVFGQSHRMVSVADLAHRVRNPIHPRLYIWQNILEMDAEMPHTIRHD